jgi:glycosyltransferase involved in cell wall biosynthesis
MINGKTLCVVLPAYNAEKTLLKTLGDLDKSLVDQIILVDDCSTDATRALTKTLPVKYAFHKVNHGYGGNQKTCYSLALASGADITVMLHPDYQYEPKLLTALASMVASGVYDVAIASRILGHGALEGGMPYYKYVANRALTFIQNLLIGQKLSEYHTGYRAFSRKVLETLPLLVNSDDFIFDNEMLVQCHQWGFKIAEISCPTKYFPEASSINFSRSLKYGFGTLRTSASYRLKKLGLSHPLFLDEEKAGQYRLTPQAVKDRIAETNVST